MGDDYLDDKISQYERKLKQAEKAGKHHKAKIVVDALRDLELRAAILGYGPNSGDDSGRVVVQPRAIAARTRSL